MFKCLSVGSCSPSPKGLVIRCYTSNGLNFYAFIALAFRPGIADSAYFFFFAVLCDIFAFFAVNISTSLTLS
jgi:hypothetical protein